MLLIIVGAAWAILGLIVAIIASARGLSFWRWLVYGLAFWPMAYVHLFVERRPRGPGSRPLGGA